MHFSLIKVFCIKLKYINWLQNSVVIVKCNKRNKRAQRALGRSLEEKVKGQGEAII